jgi:hypothetical protein
MIGDALMLKASGRRCPWVPRSAVIDFSSGEHGEWSTVSSPVALAKVG